LPRRAPKKTAALRICNESATDLANYVQLDAASSATFTPRRGGGVHQEWRTVNGEKPADDLPHPHQDCWLSSNYEMCSGLCIEHSWINQPWRPL